MIAKKGMGINLAGEGWKTGVGSTLIGLGGLETYGYAKSGGIADIAAGIIGGSILAGIGGLLIASDKKKKGKGMSGGLMIIARSPTIRMRGKIFDKHFKNTLLKKLKKYKSGGGPGITNRSIKNYLETHRDTKIHIRDIFGKDWKRKGKILMKAINKQSGGNIFSKIGHVAKSVVTKSKRKLQQFVEGKTKFKPSDLANVLATAVGIAGIASSVIPGVDLISVPAATAASSGLKLTGAALKLSGRGKMKGGRIMPSECYNVKNSDEWEKCYLEQEEKKRQKQIGFNLRRLRGRGMYGGQLEDLIELTPTEEIVSKLGDAALIAGALGISVAAGRKLMQYFKKKKKGGALKLAGMGKKRHKMMSESDMESPSMAGKTTKNLPPGVSYTSTGKVKKDRYSVYYGYYKKTSGGLTKDDFIKKGNKIVSKRKSMMGKKIAEKNFMKK